MKNIHNKQLALLLSLILAVLMTFAAAAQEPTPVVPDDEVNAIASEMFCPVCENIPLDVCGTQACHQWRELIRQKLGDGWSEEQIKDYFVAQYGDRVLAEPPRRGLNWLVYLLPPLAVPVGIYFVYRVIRSWQTPVTQPAKKSSSQSDLEDREYVAKLEKELKKRE